MTLDEIERALKRSLSTAYFSEALKRQKHEDTIDLLIRAVRQLGPVLDQAKLLLAFIDEMQNFPRGDEERDLDEMIAAVDLDVLELWREA